MINHQHNLSTTARVIKVSALMLVLLLPLSALGTRFDLWPYTAGLLLFALSVLGSLLILSINLIWNFRKPNTASRSVILYSSLLALIPLVIAMLALRNSSSDVTIHDISTDLDQPPVFVAAIIERGGNSNSLQRDADVLSSQKKYYGDIKPIFSPLSTKQAFKQAMATSQQLGWKIYAEVPAEGRIEAVATSFWFGFKDDIVIRIRATDDGSRIDLRSVSRVGKSDLGANAKRIKLFVNTFTAAQ